MDATLALAGLIEQSQVLVGAQDYEGAENLLLTSLGGVARSDAFLHFQLGRLYVTWNKLTSALNHLLKAAELAKSAGDEILVLQIVEELKLTKNRQSQQTP